MMNAMLPKTDPIAMGRAAPLAPPKNERYPYYKSPIATGEKTSQSLQKSGICNNDRIAGYPKRSEHTLTLSGRIAIGEKHLRHHQI